MKPSSAAVFVGATIVIAGTAAAQFGQHGGGFGMRLAGPGSFDGRFNFCRTVYRRNPYGDGGGWRPTYPNADIDLSIRWSELTMTH
jgi:hypothetical protein